jgi:hypothetical protein
MTSADAPMNKQRTLALFKCLAEECNESQCNDLEILTVLSNLLADAVVASAREHNIDCAQMAKDVCQRLPLNHDSTPHTPSYTANP